MMSLQELSDRKEIEQLIVRYANAIDRRDWDALDAVFTPDAYIDYRAMGGIDGRYPQVKAWLGPVLANFPRYCHLVGNIQITLEGDSARGRTLCFNPMETPLPAGGSQVMFLGLWYVDRFVRTAQGWRMSERVEEAGFQHNVPAHMVLPTS
ncbi:MAG: nuclear transport factor 2 family protein [Proteobacteria bacterium]|nr:nuclear transport factor 2 family protein [Pseudomonadota bacterium]